MEESYAFVGIYLPVITLADLRKVLDFHYENVGDAWLLPLI